MQFEVGNLVRRVGLAVAAMSCAAAQAGLLLQEHSFNLSLSSAVVRTEVGDGVGGVLSASFGLTQAPQQALTFDNFNTALGTLTGVTFWLLDSNGNNVLKIVDNGRASSDDTFDTFTRAVSASGQITRTLSGLPTLADIIKGTTVTASGCSVEAPANCASTVSDAPANTASGGQSLATAAFMGPGTFTLNARLTIPAPTLSYTPAPDCTSYAASLDGTWSGKVRIEYAYDAVTTAVPEPMSLYLVGGALVAAGWLRRRRLT